MNANHEAWKAREAKLAAALRAFIERGAKLSGHHASYDPWIGELVYGRTVLADYDAQALDDATQAFANRGKP